MASEDLFEDDLTEEAAPGFDQEIEEATEEVEATESAAAQVEPDAETASHSDKQKSSEHKLLQLPLARIRNIMKLDPDLHIASNEAVFLVTRATELFVGSIAREAYHCTTQTKKKTIQRKDVDMAINTVETLVFLDGAMF
ncbi:DNA polymerase epsilon subunit 4 [Eupeodes corollae]|uniref:DNA polymerase epsilon subunit 4 n=1 Tax=Eupeodes corollae TaxID=290404 RepID=UPI00248FD88B|nr:DNA polymerase epsilon subunit 4 [Eupeodes corollae]